MEINHALIAAIITPGELEVLHFCGYKNKPTQQERNALLCRLNTESKFNCTEVTFEIIEASTGMVKYYKELDPKDEDSYYVDETGAVFKM